jgi:hypothetical protein
MPSSRNAKIVKIKFKSLRHKQIFVNTTLLPKTHHFTPHFWRKRYVSLCEFAENENVKFHSAFLPKTLSMIKKHTVAKEMLSVATHFRQQRLVTLGAFSENGE